MNRQHARSDPRPTTVHASFEAAWHRRRQPPLSIRGPRIETPRGLWAAFSVSMDGKERIADARFEACTCTTLIAYCQVLAKTVAGTPTSTVFDWSVTDLVEWLPGVPAARWDRAVLAVAALRAALPTDTDKETNA